MTRWIIRIAVAAAALYALAAGVGIWQGSTAILQPPWYRRSPPGGELVAIEDSAEAEYFQGHTKDPLKDYGYPFEEVEFPAADGSTLRGWHVPAPADAPNDGAGIVTVHGAGDDRRGFLRHLPLLHEAGYPVVLFDCREHGTSDGTGAGISFGIREHEDVRSAVDWARKTLGWNRVGVIGSSQGGVSVLLAAARDPGIDAVVSENPFTDIHELIRIVVHRDTGADAPPGWMIDLVTDIAMWRVSAGDVPAPIDVVDQIAPRPLLLIHGSADEVVPYEHSERLHARAGETAELWIAPDAAHSAVINLYPDEFRDRVVSFFDRSLRP